MREHKRKERCTHAAKECAFSVGQAEDSLVLIRFVETLDLLQLAVVAFSVELENPETDVAVTASTCQDDFAVAMCANDAGEEARCETWCDKV